MCLACYMWVYLDCAVLIKSCVTFFANIWKLEKLSEFFHYLLSPYEFQGLFMSTV